MKFIITILTFILLSACSFNKIFLQPTKVPLGVKKLTLSSASDTTEVLFDANTFQPTFLKNGKDTIIEGAFSSHKDIAAESAGFFGRMLVTEKYSALKSIREYKKSVLIIHSSQDETIPLEMGQKLFAHANDPKEFYEIKKCHICGPEYYADSISNKIIRMLE